MERKPLTAALLFIVTLIGCSSPAPQKPAETRGLDDDAERYVDVVLALRSRDRDSVDFYAGPADRFKRIETRNLSLQEISNQAKELRVHLLAVPLTSDLEKSRRDFMVRQLQAVADRTDLLAGKRVPFDEESKMFFDVSVDDGNGAAAEKARAELGQILPGHGELDKRYADYDRQFLIPSKNIQAVLERALQECRRVTTEHIKLPDGEGVALEYTRLMPWSAFTDYKGGGHSTIRVNLDYALTVDRAFNLACHEGYPGHHTINTLVETTLIGPLKQVEQSVQPLFSPQSLRTEGAATYAPELAFSDASRMAFERDALFPLAGLNPARAEQYMRVQRLVAKLGWPEVDIARQYLDGTLEFARAAWALQERALMSFPDATLKFFNEFRSYAVTYTVGRDIAERAVNAGAADDAARWKNYERYVTGTR